MSARQLTAELARALGLPKHTTRAVLTLDAKAPPRIELTMHATNPDGKLIVETYSGECGEALARRVAQVQFMVRLEHFPDAGNPSSTAKAAP
jgi:hypothetical protein